MTRSGARPRMATSGNYDAADNKPTLFIEVQLKEESRLLPRQINAQLSKWLRQNYAQIKIGQCVDASKGAGTRSLKWGLSIAKLQIAGHSEFYTSPSDTYHVLADHDLQFFVYVLHTGDDSEESTVNEGDGVPTQFAAKYLPHKSLEGKWETLVFDEPVAEDALRAITRSVSLRNVLNRNRTLRCWISNILFYGPTGTGKTTMSLGLAQKLSIRLKDLYDTTQLLEIHSHTLLSKYFGESGKQVGRLFESICDLAAGGTQLIVITLDEVESLASSREKSSEKNEVGDVVRSTNEFLRGLDSLSELPNVVFIATSNLHGNMDAAFLDRFPYQEYVGCPGVNAGYEIMRGRINELIMDNFVSFDPATRSHSRFSRVPTDHEACSSGYSSDGASTPTLGGQALPKHSVNSNAPMLIPPLGETASVWDPQVMTASSELKRVAALGEGLSGRSLENWVTLAVCRYTVGTSCTFWELLSALEKTVKGTSVKSTEKQTPPAETRIDSEDVQYYEDSEPLDDAAEYELAMAELNTDSRMD